jgi:hypothetical protein
LENVLETFSDKIDKHACSFYRPPLELINNPGEGFDIREAWGLN